MKNVSKTDRFQILFSTVLATVAALLLTLPPFAVQASNVLDRFIQLETARPSDVGLHRVGFTITDFSEPIGSIRVQYCGNSPIIGDVCDPPAGLDASDVSLGLQVGESGFSVHGDSDDNNVILSRSPTMPTQPNLRYGLDGIENPSMLGTFYARIFTYPTDDGSGPYTQAGGVALSTNVDINIESEVPPYLTFCSAIEIPGLDCAGGNGFFVNLGEFSEASPTATSSQFLVATNAANGYSTRINGSTLTSGNNVIPALGSPAGSQSGVSQFGINLRNNSSPNIGADPTGPGTATPTANYNNINQFMFANNDVIVSSPIPSDVRKFTISYVANINEDQAPGIYTTTMSFITLANF